MGKSTAIAWTDATFNPWWGCEKVSPGCTHCYADTLDNRMYPQARHWGKNAPHRFFGDKHWDEVEYWNNKARVLDKTVKVFCGSMCDVFQEGMDLKQPRNRLFTLIEDTQYLTWLLLTKRPENLMYMLPSDWTTGSDTPDNVWLGVTIESQEQVERLRYVEPFKGIFSGVFVSAEPLIGKIEFTDYEWGLFNWLIIGGESGVGCRYMDPLWARDLMDMSILKNVPVFMKQLGGYPDKKDDIDLFPKCMRLREFPQGLE